MRHRVPRILSVLLLVGFLCGTSALAGSHSWVVKELFSDASGDVQFVELWCPPAQPNETGMNGKNVTSNAGAFHTFTSNLAPGSTGDAHILLGTAAYAALPGAAPPDHIIPSNSFSISGPDTIQWHVYGLSILSYAAGGLPTDGINSLTRPNIVGPNSPTNFAGQTGSVVVASGPPAASELTIRRLDEDGTAIELSWDTTTCSGADTSHILSGQRSDFPATPGGAYSVQGRFCFVVSPGQQTWSPSPSAPSGTLVWFLVVNQDSQRIEGSWGVDSAGNQRSGFGLNGSSGECAALDRNASNSCGE